MTYSSLQTPYSLSKFGREAEFVITLYLKVRGWRIWLSSGSKGPADIIAIRESTKLLIQVKSSTKIPRLKGYEVKRLRETAEFTGGLAVIATLQPAVDAIATDDDIHSRSADETFAEICLGNYSIFFYSLHDWKRIMP
jgi:Holliday junction resolvase